MAGRKKSGEKGKSPPTYPHVKPEDVISQRKQIGRPCEYTPEIGAEICELIACRVSLDAICKLENMPAQSTVYRWLQAVDSFRDAYGRAREFRAQARADKIDELHDRLARGEIEPNAARVLFDMERWQASKERPNTYGDNIKTEITGANGGPIQVEHQLDDFELARRLLVIAPELFDTVKVLKDNTVNGEVVENGYTRLLGSK